MPENVQNRKELWEQGRWAAAVCLSFYVKQSCSCSRRRLQNGQCVLTRKVAWDHTLSKHCHRTRHVVAVGEAGCWEQGRTQGASSQRRFQVLELSFRALGTVRGPWERGCGGLGGPGRGSWFSSARSMLLNAPAAPASAAVLWVAMHGPAST